MSIVENTRLTDMSTLGKTRHMNHCEAFPGQTVWSLACCERLKVKHVRATCIIVEDMGGGRFGVGADEITDDKSEAMRATDGLPGGRHFTAVRP